MKGQEIGPLGGASPYNNFVDYPPLGVREKTENMLS